MTWHLECDDDGDEWVVSPEPEHKYLIGNLEDTCKVCYDHARLFVHAQEMYKALQAAERTSEAKIHLEYLQNHMLDSREAQKAYTRLLTISFGLRANILAKMEKRE